MSPTPPWDRTLSRRRLMLNAGVAALAVGGLGACSSDDSGPSSGVPSSAAGASSGSGGPVSATTSEIPVGGGKIFADAQTVVTQPTKGQFKAFSSICTHARCPVAEVTDTINCKCHGSRFSITDGSVLNPPAQMPLPSKTVTVSGDALSVPA